MLLGLFNECSKEGVVPSCWKKSRVVLLKKGKKPKGEPSSYKPICLLNVVFESKLVARLDKHIVTKDGLSLNQYGFKKLTSTDDAVRNLQSRIQAKINYSSEQFCVAVSLDIKNAFNFIGWSEVMGALERFEVPLYTMKVFQDYFS